MGILSTSFGEWYLGENPAATSNVAEGTENKRILMNPLHAFSHSKALWEFISVAELGLGINSKWQSSQ